MRRLFLLLGMVALLSLVSLLQAQTITLKTQFKTNKTQSTDFMMKIRAPKGEQFFIDYGDGTEIYTGYGSNINQTYSHYFADIDQKSIHEVKIWGCPLIEFMVISNREVTEIELTQCTSLIKFSCANSLLTQLDLRECPNLQTVICNSNQISQLLLPDQVTSIDFSRNCLALADFPEKRPIITTYNYSPMRPVSIPPERITGLRVDLTNMLTFPGSGSGRSTFRWYHYTGGKLTGNPAALIDPNTYSEEEGIFTFNVQPEGPIYCVVEHPELPGLHNIADKYGIQPISLYGENVRLENVHAGFMTDKYTTTSLQLHVSLAAHADDTPCRIAWGDGVFETLTLGKEPQTVSHHFIDAKVDRIHHVQIECATLRYLALAEMSGLTALDDSIQESPIETLILDNNRIQKIDLTAFKHIKEISANGCFMQQLILPTQAPIEQLSLRNNKLSNIHLTDYPSIQELNLSINQLSDLDLSTLTSLQRVDISHNQIKNLKLPALSSNLQQFNCGYNAIPLFQLPPKGQMTEYIYAPQAPFHIPTEWISEQRVDLSPFARLCGVSNQEVPTEFIWLHATDEKKLVVKGVMYDEEEGVFTFRLPETSEIFCTMHSAAFPDLADGEKAYHTSSIQIPAYTSLSAPITTDTYAPLKISTIPGGLLLTSPISGEVVIANPQGIILERLLLEADKPIYYMLPAGLYMLQLNGYTWQKALLP